MNKFERSGLRSQAAQEEIYLDFAHLLFDPGSQLLHTDEGAWNSVEAEAVLGLRLLHIEFDYQYPITTSSVAHALLSASTEMLDDAAILLTKIGASRLLKRLRVFFAVLQRYLARTANGRLEEIADAEVAKLSQLRVRLLDGEHLSEKLWLYLDRNAGKIRGSDYSRQLSWCGGPRRNPAAFKPPWRQWRDGDLHLVSVDHYFELPKLLASQAGARCYDENGHEVAISKNSKFAYAAYICKFRDMRPVEASFVLPVGDLDALCELVEWVAFDLRLVYPRFICRTAQTLEWFCAESERQNANLISVHQGIAHITQALGGVGFFEGYGCKQQVAIGYPAVIAARAEDVLPWLIFAPELSTGWWWLEHSRDRVCKIIVGKARISSRIGSSGYFICRARTESALLAAFSHIGFDDNLCWGAVSGRLSEQNLAALVIEELSSAQTVYFRSTLAGWAYGHQWGGGAGEHFSLFHAQDLRLSEAVAAHAMQNQSQRIWRF